MGVQGERSGHRSAAKHIFILTSILVVFFVALFGGCWDLFEDWHSCSKSSSHRKLLSKKSCCLLTHQFGMLTRLKLRGYQQTLEIFSRWRKFGWTPTEMDTDVDAAMFAIHNILWHSRTLQVGYSTTSKPPVSKPGLINPGWWFSMDYPQNHPRLVIKSLLEMPSASPALESNPGLWTTIADLGVHAGKATIRRLAFSQDQHQWFLAVLYVGAFSTFTNTYWDNFSKLGCYPHIGFTID